MSDLNVALIFFLLLQIFFVVLAFSSAYSSYLFAFIAVIVSIIPIFVSITDWSWFLWLKTYSVLIPMIFYSYLNFSHFKGKTIKYLEPVFFYVLMINILEASFIGLQYAVQYRSVGLSINGISLLVLAIFTPKLRSWSFNDYKLYGFDDTVWIYSYTTVLSYFYLFSPEFELPIVRNTLMIALLGPQIIIIVLKDARTWFPARAFSLFALIIVVVIRKYFQHDFSNTKISIPMTNSSLGYLLLTLNVLAIAYLIRDRVFIKKIYETNPK